MTKAFNWPVIIWMAAVHALGLVALAHFSLANLTALIILWYISTCLGITLGYHRLLSHKAFRAPVWVTRVLATCGALAAQLGPIDWVGLHRQHHKHADAPGDPHSSREGFFHCHFGWMMHECEADAQIPRYTKDLATDPYLVWLNKWFVVVNVIVGIGLHTIGGWSMVLWGIALRLVLGYHCTWLVNSATHFFGYRRYDTPDEARNCWWVALLSWGEGWHNNHHNRQNSAKTGEKWWEFDITWYHVWLMRQLGLATRVVT